VAEVGIYIGIGTFGLTVIAYAVKLTWQVTRIEREQGAYIDAKIDDLRRDMVNVDRGSLERAESVRHETGEMGSALRTKIHDVETWARDTFVRKDSFDMVIGRLEKSIDKLGDKIEEKLDKLAERFQKSD
jgi:phosphoenolpyruvate synthase/pyruvate phosphate dikinase